jgi:glucose-1-phosphate thymidylyltransferase
MSLTAVLLAAGYATRLYPLTKDLPKALLPLGRGVILDAVIEGLGPEVSRRVLVTNHRFIEQFRRWQRERGSDLELVDDGTDRPETRLGAIRDLEVAREAACVEGDLLVVGTDNLCTWSLSAFVAQARPHAPALSLAVWQAPSPQAATHVGVVTLDADGLVRVFAEKSPQPPSTLVALCQYYFPWPMCGRLRQFLEEQPRADAPGHFVKWLADREPVYGVRMRGAWHDIGTPESYRTAAQEWEAASGTPRSAAGG